MTSVARLVVLVVLASGCGRVFFAIADIEADACAPGMFFADVDGDGHGDPQAALSACMQPPGAATIADDCDDTERHRYPGATEVCDGLDNDCSAATPEVCMLQCAPARRPAPDDAHTYLLCGADQTWTGAQQACMNEGFTLAIIDDDIEDAWLLTEMTTRFGTVDTFIGGADVTTEGSWLWPDGSPFWQGDAGGGPVGGRYANWNVGEPNNGGAAPPENCLLQLSTGSWNDSGCSVTTRKFACERN